jgi:hypothetical protein
MNSMEKVSRVREEDLKWALGRLRDLRAHAIRRGIDPWAIRQALLIAIEFDTQAALERGISLEELYTFDQIVKRDTGLWIQTREVW